jgi:pimeloyl-ACP methyl ester carboxylesterase
VPAELNSLESAPRVTAPAVFLIAGRDSLVPPKYQRRVAAAYAGEKRIIDLPAASHWDPITGDADRQLHEAIDWMWTQAATPSSARSSSMPVSAAGAPQ